MIAIGQRLRRRDHDGVPGVDAHRVEVLHVADRDAGIGRIPHHLVLDLLPSPQRALDQDLVDRRGVEAAGRDPLEVGLGGDEAAACSAQRVRRPDDQRQPDLGGELADVLERLAHARGGNRLSDLLEHVLEGLAVLRLADGFDSGAEQPHLVPVEDAR